MKLAHEFKEFIARGNVIDLAVGVIIGAAFGKIVTSLVNDIVMPPIGVLTNGVNFAELYVQLNGESYANIAAAQAASAPMLMYGNFINTVIQFLIVAACIFAMVKVINRIKREETAKPDAIPAAPARSEVLLEEIRDLLKK